jgi:hypothetical protein
MFGLKYRSLLQFDDDRVDATIQHNLGTLYGVTQVPCDTYMRERLDPIEPQGIQRAFQAGFRAVQRGKMLPLFDFEGYYLVSCDGTGFFHSKSVHCDDCCQAHHRDGSVSYYHQMMSAVLVHPNQSVVLPMGIEPIQKADGQRKNDCERNGAQRLLTKLRAMHPKLKMMVVEDALHANTPHIQFLQSQGYAYLISVKPKNHRWLFDWVNQGNGRTQTLQRNGYRYEFRWFNGVPLTQAADAIEVNFFDCREVSPKGRVRTFSWITDRHITAANVFQLMKGGRARWKIENETFQTLKTQGYHFEHNYGHGYQHLSTILAHLMMVAFLVDQIQQLACPQFQAALKRCRRRIRLWERMRSVFFEFFVESWDVLFQTITHPPHIWLTAQSPPQVTEA